MSDQPTEPSPIDLAALARRVFEAQPFTRLVGAELVDAGPGTATLALDIRDALRQQHGFVHGGVVSYLADNTITFAGGLALRGNALTAEFKINYLRPARGPRLVARATARHAGRRQAVCTCEVFEVVDGEERLCAVALGTVVAAAEG